LTQRWNVTGTITHRRERQVLDAERLTEPAQTDPFIDSSIHKVDVAWRDPERQVGKSMPIEQGSGGGPRDWLQSSVGNLTYPDRFRMRKVLHQRRIDLNQPAEPVELFPPTLAHERIRSTIDAVPDRGPERPDTTHERELLDPILNLHQASAGVEENGNMAQLQEPQGGRARHASRREAIALLLQDAINVKRENEVRLDNSLEVEGFGQPRMHQGGASPFRGQEACIG
jgi:hypothetical protein